MLDQNTDVRRALLEAEGWAAPQITRLEAVRERQDRADLEQTLESCRLVFMRGLYETGRLTDRRRKRP